MKKSLIAPLAFVLGIIVAASIIIVSVAAPSTTPEGIKPVFPTNTHGETYGSVMELTNLDEYPDLIAAVGEDGIEGYIRQSEADPFEPKNPEEALAWQEEYMAQGGFHYCNLYDKEGEVIGKFRAGLSADYDPDQIEGYREVPLAD